MSTAHKLARADYIEATPGVCGGKPRIAGTRIKVSLVARLHAQGQSEDDIVDAYPHLTLAQVHAALTYYFDHLDDIHAEWRASEEMIAGFKRKLAPSESGKSSGS